MAIESIVVGVAFVVSCALLYAPVSKIVRNSLDFYKKRISDEIEFNTESRNEYQEILSKVLKRYDNLDKEVEALLIEAKNHYKLIEQDAKNNAEKLIVDKLHSIECNAKLQFERYMLQMRSESVEIAFRVIRDFARENLSSENDQRDMLIVTKSIMKN